MNVMIRSLGWALLHSLWQGALIWLSLRAVLAMLMRHSSNIRYLVSCLALALAAFAFLATFTEFEFFGQGGSTGIEKGVVSHRASGVSDSVFFTNAFWDGGSVRSAKFNASLMDLLPGLVLFWAAGCLWCSARLAFAWKGAARLLNTSRRPVPGWLEIRCRYLAGQLGIERMVQISESALVDVPCVVGWLRPVILFPISALSGLDPIQLEGLLSHELGHIARHDYLVNLLQSFCDIVFFYHPAIRSISRTIRAEREQACDDVAVTLTGDAHGYATALTQLEELRCPSLVLAASGRGGLVERVRRLVASPAAVKSDHTSFSWITFAGTAFVFTILLVASGLGFRLHAQRFEIAASTVTAPNPPDDSAADFPYKIAFVPYSVEWGRFSADDNIVITSVRGDRAHIGPGGRYLVEGTYRLSSMESATLGLSVTAPSPESPGAISPVSMEQWTWVSRGAGTFSLKQTMSYEGSFHVSFTPPETGESRGTVYFREGTSGKVGSFREPEVSRTIKISIDRDGAILIDGKSEESGHLALLLTEAHAAHAETSALIEANGKTQLEKLTFVMDVCRKAGIKKLSLRTL